MEARFRMHGILGLLPLCRHGLIIMLLLVSETQQQSHIPSGRSPNCSDGRHVYRPGEKVPQGARGGQNDSCKETICGRDGALHVQIKPNCTHTSENTGSHDDSHEDNSITTLPDVGTNNRMCERGGHTYHPGDAVLFGRGITMCCTSDGKFSPPQIGSNCSRFANNFSDREDDTLAIWHSHNTSTEAPRLCWFHRRTYKPGEIITDFGCYRIRCQGNGEIRTENVTGHANCSHSTNSSGNSTSDGGSTCVNSTADHHDNTSDTFLDTDHDMIQIWQMCGQVLHPFFPVNKFHVENDHPQNNTHKANYSNDQHIPTPSIPVLVIKFCLAWGKHFFVLHSSINCPFNPNTFWNLTSQRGQYDNHTALPWSYDNSTSAGNQSSIPGNHTYIGGEQKNRSICQRIVRNMANNWRKWKRWYMRKPGNWMRKFPWMNLYSSHRPYVHHPWNNITDQWWNKTGGQYAKGNASHQYNRLFPPYPPCNLLYHIALWSDADGREKRADNHSFNPYQSGNITSMNPELFNSNFYRHLFIYLKKMSRQHNDLFSHQNESLSEIWRLWNKQIFILHHEENVMNEWLKWKDRPFHPLPKWNFTSTWTGGRSGKFDKYPPRNTFWHGKENRNHTNLISDFNITWPFFSENATGTQWFGSTPCVPYPPEVWKNVITRWHLNGTDWQNPWLRSTMYWWIRRTTRKLHSWHDTTWRISKTAQTTHQWSNMTSDWGNQTTHRLNPWRNTTSDRGNWTTERPYTSGNTSFGGWGWTTDRHYPWSNETSDMGRWTTEMPHQWGNTTFGGWKWTTAPHYPWRNETSNRWKLTTHRPHTWGNTTSGGWEWNATTGHYQWSNMSTVWWKWATYRPDPWSNTTSDWWTWTTHKPYPWNNATSDWGKWTTHRPYPWSNATSDWWKWTTHKPYQWSNATSDWEKWSTRRPSPWSNATSDWWKWTTHGPYPWSNATSDWWKWTTHKPYQWSNATPDWWKWTTHRPYPWSNATSDWSKWTTHKTYQWSNATSDWGKWATHKPYPRSNATSDWWKWTTHKPYTWSNATSDWWKWTTRKPYQWRNDTSDWWKLTTHRSHQWTNRTSEWWMQTTHSSYPWSNVTAGWWRSYTNRADAWNNTTSGGWRRTTPRYYPWSNGTSNWWDSTTPRGNYAWSNSTWRWNTTSWKNNATTSMPYFWWNSTSDWHSTRVCHHGLHTYWDREQISVDYHSCTVLICHHGSIQNETLTGCDKKTAWTEWRTTYAKRSGWDVTTARMLGCFIDGQLYHKGEQIRTDYSSCTRLICTNHVGRNATLPGCQMQSGSDQHNPTSSKADERYDVSVETIAITVAAVAFLGAGLLFFLMRFL